MSVVPKLAGMPYLRGPRIARGSRDIYLGCTPGGSGSLQTSLHPPQETARGMWTGHSWVGCPRTPTPHWWGAGVWPEAGGPPTSCPCWPTFSQGLGIPGVEHGAPAKMREVSGKNWMTSCVGAKCLQKWCWSYCILYRCCQKDVDITVLFIDAVKKMLISTILFIDDVKKMLISLYYL